MQNNRQTGSGYERIAAAYLIQQGLEIVAYNYRNRRAEIDLVARDQEYLVFIEVKYRSSQSNGNPAEAVDARKQSRIRYAAQSYLYSHAIGEEQPCRFDVVSILGDELIWYQDAF